MNNNISSYSMSSNYQTIFNSTKFFQITGALSQIILLILFFIWILKKLSSLKISNIASSIKILDKILVGPHESIIIVEINTVKLVLGVTEKNITHLYTLQSTLQNNKLSEEKKILY